MVILKFKEMNWLRIASRSVIRIFGGVPAIRRVKLNRMRISLLDLIGLKVLTDEGEEFGTVKDILQTAALTTYI